MVNERSIEQAHAVSGQQRPIARPGMATTTTSALSFLIPTFNRMDVLPLCLEHLERQTFADFEVILVDDGSTDGTAAWIADYAERTPLRLRSVRLDNGGPARARNVAVALAQAEISVIIGDDILCTPTFAATHLAFHREHPEVHFAALGLTRWSETEQVVTPFMRWLDESGAQFAYGDLLRGEKPDWRFFYTSNLSVKTALLRRHPFSEAFPFPNMEDIEMGYRLSVEEQMDLTFLPAALAAHVHPTDFRRAAMRAYRTGISLQVFDRLWPDRPRTPHGWVHGAIKQTMQQSGWLLRPATSLAERVTRVWCPNPLLRAVLGFQMVMGQRHPQ